MFSQSVIHIFIKKHVFCVVGADKGHLSEETFLISGQKY